MGTDPFSRQGACVGYPALNPEQITGLNALLVEAVELRHGGRLTGAQRAELVGCMAIQTRTAEVLHQFPLANADEPAFIRPPIETDRG